MARPLAVLIVEDSESDAQLVVRLLQKAGYEVAHRRVETPEEMRAALDLRVWDLVIADHRLPRFDAPAALRLLQETDLDIPFIVVSGSIGEEIAVAMMKAGAHDYLIKDNLSRLVPAIEREMGQAEMRRDRKRGEVALLQAQERLRRAASAGNVGLWDWDLRTNEVYYSPEWKRQIGHTEAEIAGDIGEWRSRLHPEDLDRVLAG